MTDTNTLDDVGQVDTVEFDSRNTCLLAEPPASTLRLGQSSLEDFLRLLPSDL